jgi:TetR/AcrR family transcriptional repressor of nem operon
MPRKKAYEVEEVLEKAMHTFWQNGFERTSVRMLEKDMGINQFSIYDSFGNKQDLFIEVLKKYKDHVGSTFLKDLKASKGRLADIRKFLSDYSKTVREGKQANGCLMVNTSLEVGHKDEKVLRQLELYFEFIKKVLRHALDKAKAIGELPQDFDTEKKSLFLLGSLQGLSVYAKFQQPEEIEAFIDQTMATLN